MFHFSFVSGKDVLVVGGSILLLHLSSFIKKCISYHYFKLRSAVIFNSEQYHVMCPCFSANKSISTVINYTAVLHRE